MRNFEIAFVFLAAACSSPTRGSGTHADLGGSPSDFAGLVASDGPPVTPSGDASQPGCAGQSQGCYTVYAHSDTVLYTIDLNAKTLVEVGPFNAPKINVGTSMQPDIITDLAVAPDNTIYVISNTNLYTASAVDGHVTLVGAVTSCGSKAVALTFTVDGTLYAGDYKGALCTIDLSTMPLAISKTVTLSGGVALAGDLVAIDDGTMYGTVYDLSGSASAVNSLAKIDPATGTTTVLGSTGSSELFGAAYALGQVFGFTHDGSGKVITMNPMTGAGTAFNTFMDPSSNKGIKFAGAGVNSMVPATIQ